MIWLLDEIECPKDGLDLLLGGVIEGLKGKPAWTAVESHQVKGVFDGGDAVLSSESLVERGQIMLEFFGVLQIFSDRQFEELNAERGRDI